METTRARFAPTLHTANASKRTTFSGYASVFDTLIDAPVPTIIKPGAFQKTLADNRSRIKVLWQHNADFPIGVPDVLREDSRGLFIEARLADTDRAKEAAQLLRDGVITEMSIGFDPITSYTDRTGPQPVRVLTELKLWEVSLVTFAANREARVTSVHSRKRASPEHLADLEQELADFDRRQFARRMGELRELQLALLDSAVRRGR